MRLYLLSLLKFIIHCIVLYNEWDNKKTIDKSAITCSVFERLNELSWSALLCLIFYCFGSESKANIFWWWYATNCWLLFVSFDLLLYFLLLLLLRRQTSIEVAAELNAFYLFRLRQIWSKMMANSYKFNRLTNQINWIDRIEFPFSIDFLMFGCAGLHELTVRFLSVSTIFVDFKSIVGGYYKCAFFSSDKRNTNQVKWNANN